MKYQEISGEQNCVNNNLPCRFNKSGTCTISDSEIDSLFIVLVEKNILSKWYLKNKLFISNIKHSIIHII